MISLADVPRNDPDKAREYYQAHKPLSFEEYRVLRMLQDDPEFFDVMTGVDRWEIEDRGQQDLVD